MMEEITTPSLTAENQRLGGLEKSNALLFVCPTLFAGA